MDNKVVTTLARSAQRVGVRPASASISVAWARSAGSFDEGAARH